MSRILQRLCRAGLIAFRDCELGGLDPAYLSAKGEPAPAGAGPGRRRNAWR